MILMSLMEGREAEPVRIGVVGCGVVGNQHIQYAQQSPLTTVVAVADMDASRARETAEAHGVKKSFADARLLIEDPEVEAVILALPTGIRLALALHAFECGKHVLIEKPVAMNVGEIRQMMRARGKSVCGACSSRYRFLPSSQFLTEFIATGALGNLRVIHCRGIAPAGPPPTKPLRAWRVSRAINGGGFFANFGSYDLDFLLGITGWRLRPRYVLAGAWSIASHLQHLVAAGSDAEEHAAAFITCDGGTVISIDRGECTASQPESVCSIVGSRGALHLQMAPGQGKKIVFDSATAENGVQSEVVWQGDEERTPLYAGVVDDFALAVRSRRPPSTDLRKCLVLQKIIDAVYASAEKGRPVRIP